MVTNIQVCVVCGGKFKNIKILSDGFFMLKPVAPLPHLPKMTRLIFSTLLFRDFVDNLNW